jgi:PAS domain S-box-containing protein
MKSLEAMPSTKTNILIVDDRPEGLMALEAVLSCPEYHLIQAHSGEEALQYALFYDFAVVLLDVQMPELDGFETAKRLREHYRSKEVPIIFVTAINKELRHINEGYATGAVDYIFKPFDPFILKSKVTVFVELFNKNLQVKRQAELLREMALQEKERQMLELKQENSRRYANLADAIPHVIIKIGLKGNIPYFNQQWCEYTGLGSNVDWRLLISPQDRKKFLMFWRNLRRTNSQTSQIELRIRHAKEDTYRWNLVRAVSEKENGKITGWICTCTDIHDIKKAEEKFRLLSQELNLSNKELEEFAYVVSHDLKEPLHVVSSFTHLLQKRVQTKLNEKEQEYITFIQESILHAQTLIKDLLEYSRIGKKKSWEVVDLSFVLKEILGRMSIIVNTAVATITYDHLPTIKGNHLEMVQLFQNLISNAIKYRSAQPPQIHISVDAQSDQWLFSIKDNGIGIDPQFKENIFGMFQRLHPKSKYTGSGIGLAICKKIVENHGGKIWVESQIGQGATFYFTIKRETSI